jgi:hypothetical protein
MLQVACSIGAICHIKALENEPATAAPLCPVCMERRWIFGHGRQCGVQVVHEKIECGLEHGQNVSLHRAAPAPSAPLCELTDRVSLQHHTSEAACTCWEAACTCWYMLVPTGNWEGSLSWLLPHSCDAAGFSPGLDPCSNHF